MNIFDREIHRDKHGKNLYLSFKQLTIHLSC